jgi:hypothetical protein
MSEADHGCKLDKAKKRYDLLLGRYINSQKAKDAAYIAWKSACEAYEEARENELHGRNDTI